MLCGLAYARLEQLDKAEKAYSDATAVHSEQALAWQGLVDLYEKHGPMFSDLSKKVSTAYKKMLVLEDVDKAKKYEICGKLADVLCGMDSHEEAIEVLRSCAQYKDLSEEDNSSLTIRMAEVAVKLDEASTAKYKIRHLGSSTRQV